MNPKTASTRVPSSSSAKPPDAICARDLQAVVFPPIAWVVPRLIADGLTLLAGTPKRGKSWLTLGISVAIGRGAP